MALACDDVVSGLGCEFVATGENPSEMKDAMMQHGSDVHGNLLDGLPDDVVEQRKIAMSERIDQLIAGIR